MGRKCEVYFCSHSEEKNAGRSFFGFPRDVERCSRWITSCESPELSATFAEGGPEAVRKLKICSDHFDNTSFRNPLQPPKGLRSDAIPTVNIKRAHQTSDDRAYLDTYENIEYLDVEYIDLVSDDYHRQYNMEYSESFTEEMNGSANVSTDFYEDVEFLDSAMENVLSTSDSLNIVEQEIPNSLGLAETDEHSCHCHKTKTTIEWSFELNSNTISDDLQPDTALSDYDQTSMCVEYQNPEQTSPDLESIEFSVINTSQVDYKSLYMKEKANSSNLKNQIWDLQQTLRNKLQNQKSQSSEPYPIKFETNDDELPGTNIPKVDYKSLYSEERLKSSNMINIMKELQRALRYEKRKSKWRKQSVATWKKRNHGLRNEIKHVQKQKVEDAQISRLVRSDQVLHNSLMNRLRKPKGRRYNAAFKKFAMGTYLASPAGYRFIQRSKTLSLPHKMSIGRWKSAIRLDPGLSKEILNRVASKTKGFSKKEKAVAICIDGMSIKPELTYSAKADTFIGFQDDGKKRKYENNDPMTLATEAIAVVVSGITTYHKQSTGADMQNEHNPGNQQARFKQAIGYILAHNTPGSKMQFDLVQDAARALRIRGLYPLAVIMDQGTTNVKMVEEAGATQDNSVIKVDNHHMAVIFDSPHLLKNSKNMLMKHNAVFEKKIASFSHIKQLYETDCISIPRLVPKLKERYIYPTPFLAMNVAQASRTLSNSVAKGIKYYVQLHELPDKALGTAAFVEFHDMLFDVFNSRPNSSCKKPYRGPITDKSCHWSFLEKAEAVLRSMYYTVNTCFSIQKAKKESKLLTAKQRKPNYVGGFIGNIISIRWLWNKLQDEFNCEKLCTNFLCQDCVENLFGEIRRRCGSNDTPNAFQCAAAFRCAAISASEKLAEGTNCEPDNAETLFDENDIVIEDFTEISEPAPIKFTYKFQPLNRVEPNKYSLRDLNGVMYILGAAVGKIPHNKCRKQLTMSLDEIDTENHLYRFCRLKNATHYPDSKLFEIGLLAYNAFKQKFSKFLHQNRRQVKTRLKEYVNYCQFKDYVCQRCFKVLVDKIFNILIQNFLRDAKEKLLMQQKSKRLMAKTKRNRKATRMNLPFS